MGERTCVEKMNEAVSSVALWGPMSSAADFGAVMFVGDDHVFGTPGWDKLIVDALAERPGVVWPDVPGDRYCHPTVWAMSRSLINALGWFMLPTQRHYYVDDAIAQVGIRAGVATWLEDVKVPHLHYRLTGAPSDSVYERAQGWLDEDRDNYWKWLREQSEADVERVRGAM